MRRLNIKFAIILGVVLAASGIGIHLLHAYQVEESAKGLPERAEAFKREGRYEEAYSSLRRYTIMQPKDPEGWDRLGDYLIEWLEKLAQTPKEQRRAFGTALEDLETVVINRPENVEFRKKAAEYQLIASQLIPARINDARQHFQRLVEIDPNDVESRIRLAICDYRTNDPQARTKAINDLYALVGFDASTQSFDPTKGQARDQLAAYQALSDFLRQELKDNTMADRVLDAMVDANPQNHRAYLLRGTAHLRMQRNDRAKSDIDRALELDAKNEDLDVLLRSADVALQRQEFERADEVLEIAARKFPTNPVVYLYRIQLAQSRGQPEKAMDYVLDGLSVKENKNNSVLLYQKAWLQAFEGDLAAAKETAKTAETAAGGVRNVDGDLLEAFITLRERKFVEAARRLETLRTREVRSFDENRIDQWLSECYGALDQIDLQIDALRRLLGRQPSNVGVMLNLSRALGAIGKTDEAWDLLERVRKQFGEGEEGAEKFATATEAWRVYYEMALRRELRKPEKNRDWSDINRMLSYVEKYRGDSLLIDKYRLDILLREEKIEEARAKLDALLARAAADASRPASLDLWLMHVRLLAAEKDKGIDKALEALDDVEKRFGDTLEIRLQRAQLIARPGNPNAASELAVLEANAEKIDRDALWRGLAVSYLTIGATDEAMRLWKLVIAADPNDLRTRLAMFEQSLRIGDAAGTDEALKEIEKLMGKDSDQVHYCQAMRLLRQATGGENTLSVLKEAQDHLKKASEKRPRWHLPYRLAAQIDRAVNDRENAVANFMKALELGPPDVVSIESLARLYFERADYAAASKAIDRLGEAKMPKVLRQIEVELALAVARERSQPPRQAAELTAALIGDLESDKQITPQDYMWQARMLREFRQPQQAEQALRKAAELNPNDASVSLALVEHLSSQRKFSEASDVVRDLELKLADEALMLIRPRCYQLIGKFDQAERLLKDLVAGDPKNLGKLQELAQFYQNVRRPQQAEEVIDTMLALGGPRLHPSLVWARRAKAAMLAATRDFPDFEEAMKLLAANYINGEPTLADLNLEVQFLSARGEFTYRDQAINRLLEIRSRRNLPTDMQLMLADLYNRTNQWDKCRDVLYKLANEESRNPIVLSRVITMFLEQKELRSAQTQLNVLKRRVPDSPETVLLQARLDAAEGNTAKAAADLAKLIPPPPASPDLETDENLRLISVISTEYQRLKRYDDAEKLMRRIVAAKPEGEMGLAVFFASTGVAAKIDEAIAIGDRLAASKGHVARVNLGTQILTAARGKLSTQQIEAVKGWYAAAKLAEPTSLSVKLQTAQMHDALGDHKQAVEIYREVLAQKDLDVTQRGFILNNAAFLSAVNGGDLDEALGWAEESLRLLGERSEVYDTRGMVYYVRGEYDKAGEDFRKSVRGGPTAVKIFHLALAEHAAGNTAAAEAAWRDAQIRGIDEHDLVAPEQALLAKLKAAMPADVSPASTDASDSSPDRGS